MDSQSSSFFRNESTLIEKAKMDNNAFNMLYEFYFPKIYGFVSKRTGDRESAEDIVSLTFTQAFVHLEKYQHKDSTFGAWLYKIASNKLIDYYRKEGGKKIVPIDDNDTIEIEFESSIDLDIQARNVRETLKKLPAKYQKIITLKFYSDLSNEEISQVMDISLNNVYVLLFRALKKFKKLFKQYE